LSGNNYQKEPSRRVLPICRRKNINQFKVKLKSIYQNLVETTFDKPTLFSWLVRVRDVILLFPYLSRLSLDIFCAGCSAYLDYNLFNVHVAMCDNDNVVTDEMKLINK
jgi:hypothetical protein